MGLAPHELNALKSVCRLSQQAGRPFGHALAEPDEAADLFVVAMDHAESVAQWREADPRALCPFVAAGRLPADMPGGVELPKPFLASRLLAAMDACAALAADARSAGTRSARPDATTAAIAEPPALASQARGRSILLVDDSPTVRKQLELVLRSIDLQPHCTASGEEALFAVERYAFDLILLDVVLPGADGYQVCKTLKKNPRTRNIPIVMLTSKSSPFDKIRGSFAGCDSYLTKPLAQADFKAVVKKYLPQLATECVFSDSVAAGGARALLTA
ncbi:MAG: response regulator [Burkholderiaceae bacterium]